MRIDYSDGSFMLSWEKVRAWFRADGTLKDAEYKRMRRGYPVAVHVPAKHTKTIAFLTKEGKREADMLARGILKRAVYIAERDAGPTPEQITEQRIIDAMARAFFAVAYAEQWENAGSPRSLNPAGRDWLDLLPVQTDTHAVHAATTLMRDFLCQNTQFGTLAEFLTYVQTGFRHGGDRPRTADALGHAMAMQSMGSGVTMADAFGKDAEDFKIPHVEFSDASLARDYF